MRRLREKDVVKFLSHTLHFYLITTMFDEMCFKLVFSSKALITDVTPVF